MSIDNHKFEMFVDKKIFLAPYNDLTKKLAIRLAGKGQNVAGFFDRHKRHNNVFGYGKKQEYDFVIVSSPNYWHSIVDNFAAEKVLIHQTESDFFLPLDEYLQGISEKS
ncbi:MAG: hypothetical protein ACI965_001647, partial [Paraglaciecola sp.]